MTRATPSRPSRNAASASGGRAPGARPARRASRSRAGRGTRRTARASHRCRSAPSGRRRSAPRPPTTAPAITSRVTREVLGGGLDDEVGAVLERAADHRRRERVVDREQRAVAVGGLGEGREVGEDARRVGDRLDVEDPRRGRGQRGLDGGDVGRVDVRDVDAEAPEGRDGLRPGRAVAHLPTRSRSPARGARGTPRGSRPCRSRARCRPRRRGAPRSRRRARRRWGCRSGCRRSRAGRRARTAASSSASADGERRGLVDRDGRRHLADVGDARRGADRAGGGAGPGSLVGHAAMLHRVAGGRRAAARPAALSGSPTGSSASSAAGRRTSPSRARPRPCAASR